MQIVSLTLSLSTSSVWIRKTSSFLNMFGGQLFCSAFIKIVWIAPFSSWLHLLLSLYIVYCICLIYIYTFRSFWSSFLFHGSFNYCCSVRIKLIIIKIKNALVRKELSLDLRLIISKCYVFSVLLYGCEG